MTALDRRFNNPHALPKSVSCPSVRVQEFSAPNATCEHPCDVEHLAVDQVRSSVVIRLAPPTTGTHASLDLAHRTSPRVGILARAVDQDGCQGASPTRAYGRVRGAGAMTSRALPSPLLLASAGKLSR
jgi:hypothetical protein